MDVELSLNDELLESDELSVLAAMLRWRLRSASASEILHSEDLGVLVDMLRLRRRSAQ